MGEKCLAITLSLFRNFVYNIKLEINVNIWNIHRILILVIFRRNTIFQIIMCILEILIFDRKTHGYNTVISI